MADLIITEKANITAIADKARPGIPIEEPEPEQII